MNPISPNDGSPFTARLAHLLNEGVPLQESLETIERELPDGDTLKEVLFDVGYRVLSGEPLCDAMSLHPLVFEKTYVKRVKQGEHGCVIDGLATRRLIEPQPDFVTLEPTLETIEARRNDKRPQLTLIGVLFDMIPPGASFNHRMLEAYKNDNNVTKALEVLRKEPWENDFAGVLDTMHDHCLSGGVLSSAMQQFPALFSPGYVDEIDFAVMTGELEDVFQKYSQL